MLYIGKHEDTMRIQNGMKFAELTNYKTVKGLDMAKEKYEVKLTGPLTKYKKNKIHYYKFNKNSFDIQNLAPKEKMHLVLDLEICLPHLLMMIVMVFQSMPKESSSFS